ncbi:hypothetical protein BGZ83_008265 [Gryganskiella cystojenkinii]|nr:hypothetical protein BGZ83_008265 [Gryganskiella cystojenkinii]
MSPSTPTRTTSTSTGTKRTTTTTTTRSSKFSISALSCLILTLGCLPWTSTADIVCTQKGSDTIRVGATVKFGWNDTASYPIETFQLDLYCIENERFMQTLSTLNTTGSVSPQTWVVNQTIMAQTALCQSNQYRGRFNWNSTDPTTGALISGFADCKSMLLVGPGVIPPPGGGNPDPSQDLPPEEPESGPIVITDRTKTIVIGVGCAVGALVLAGFIGFYYIRFSNKRAVQAQISKKLREPLDHSPYGGSINGGGGSRNGSTIAPNGGSGLFAAGSGTRYNELTSVTASIAGYSPVQNHQQSQQLPMVELNGQRPYSDHDSLSSSRPQTPIAAAHSNSPTLGPRPNSFLPSVGDRPTSLLTSSFTPPPEPRSQRQQREAEYEQQRLFEEHQHHQQQQQQMQQQQQSYSSYQY